MQPKYLKELTFSNAEFPKQILFHTSVLPQKAIVFGFVINIYMLKLFAVRLR